jgi:hypothetical protein
MIGLERSSRTDIGLGIEAHAAELEYLADGSHESRIQMLGAQPVITGIALHAFAAIDSGAIDGRVNVNGSNRADVNTITAGNTFIWIDLHRAQLNSSTA